MSTAYKTTVEDEIPEMNERKIMVDAQTQTLGTDDGDVKDVKKCMYTSSDTATR